MSENRCVCCGEVIPEGRQVCPYCEAEGSYTVEIAAANRTYTICGSFRQCANWTDMLLRWIGEDKETKVIWRAM